MRGFGWDADFVRKRITGAQGWAYYTWLKLNESNIWGGGLELSNGYVSQEIEKLKRKKHG